MVRISYQQLNDSHEIALLSSKIIKEISKLHNYYKMLLNSPSVAQEWINFLIMKFRKYLLGNKIRKLSNMRIAFFNKADYQFKIHFPFGLKAGQIRGGNHAWGNRSNKPAVVVVAKHDIMDIK